MNFKITGSLQLGSAHSQRARSLEIAAMLSIVDVNDQLPIEISSPRGGI